MILILILTFSLVLNCVLAVFAVRFAYRTVQYDNFITFLSSDIFDAVVELKKLTTKELYSNIPEIIAVHRLFVSLMANLVRYKDVIEKRGFISNIKGEIKPKDNKPIFID